MHRDETTGDETPKKEAIAMEDKLPINGGLGIRRVLRDCPPAHYLFKVESFTLFAGSRGEKYESGVFEAGGYKWRLLFYPKGDKKANGDGFISLYLEIADTESLPVTWQLNVLFKLFVLDQIQDKYLTVEDADGQVKRFYKMKTMRGFDKFLSMDSFNDPSNGYLIDDCCVFGAEVFVVECASNYECFSMIKPPAYNTITWRMVNFSKLDGNQYYTDSYTVHELRWRLIVYPKGDDDLMVKGRELSVFLELSEAASVLLQGQKLYVEVDLRIRDECKSNHRGKQIEHWFSRSASNWGFKNFMTLKDLHDESNGFLVNDTLTFEAEFNVIGKSKKF